MGIKAKIETFASSKGIVLRDYQKNNLRNIERDFESKKIEVDAVVSMVSREIGKEGRLLSSGEQRELKSKMS
ncbi:MAG: hypothetical protein ACD_7C00535G0002 [uncultured bacterium]|nr:MAG: hypothetical protein ACD_7C00535G0002 [uncultured bacterium]HBR79688.1 hypothetical protein [Candidatus Moranbacteria bacterium]